MKWTLAISALFAAEAVTALPSTVLPKGHIDLGDGIVLVPRKSTMQQRRAARKASSHVSNETQVSYSSNWAGAVLVGSGYTQVAGTITVPKASGGSNTAASAWVGIDGDTCSTAIAQTGVDFGASSGSYDAWYEWFPDYAYTFSGLTVTSGNSISMSVTATSKSAGSVTVTNKSTGKTATHSFSGETSDPLCETNAEWIVEDFEQNGQLVPFANFGTVTFSGLSPSASGAQVLDIKQGSTVYTSCSASSASVSCTYV